MDANSKTVKVCRFFNLLDDSKYAEGIYSLSPTKFNSWAANMGAISALIATVFAFIGNHVGGVESIWAAILGWNVQAHTSRLMVNREQNKNSQAITKIKAGGNNT